MAEKGSSFNKLLILIILAGGFYIYYDKSSREPQTSNNPDQVGPSQNPADPSNNSVEPVEPLQKALENNNFNDVINILSQKKELTEDEQLQLALAYQEVKDDTKAKEVFKKIEENESYSPMIKALAKMQKIILEVKYGDIKLAMEEFLTYAKGLDPANLPTVSSELGDILWEKFGDKTNHYWLEIHYAYGLAYHGLVDGDPKKTEIEEKLNTINHYIFFKSGYVTNMLYHKVVSNDNLTEISKKYNVSKDVIQLANGLENSSTIREGQQLKIVEGVATVKINKNTYEMVVYLNGMYLKRYRIGIGKENKTPEGVFRIEGSKKQIRPSWYNRKIGEQLPYSENGENGNPLGTHWIPFLDAAGYGIHGTWQPQSIGQNMSNGCIRMLNEEVKEVYAFLDSRSTVEIY